ncbi:MAG: CHASE2 domain-containing protein, partial [Desulfosarcina sp.]
HRPLNDATSNRRMTLTRKKAPPLTSRRRNPGDERRCLVFGLLLTLLAAVLTVFPPAGLRYLDGRLYDSMLQSLPEGPVHPLPGIVAIDDRSLAMHGQWPWSRRQLAVLLQNIHDLGASVIGLDVVLAEADRCSVRQVLSELHRQTGQPLPGDWAGLPDNDEMLARTLTGAPVTLGYKFLFHPPEKESKSKWLHPLDGLVVRETPGYACKLRQASRALCNLPLFSRSATSSGFINVGSDPDGVLRRVPLFMRYHGRWYPDLALACLIMHSGQGEVAVTSDRDGLGVRWNGRQIPLDPAGNLLLRYRGTGRTFPFYAAADILAGRIPAGALKDKIVFVGASASGLGDLHLTPLDKRFPGPEVHATVVDNLMSGNFLHRPGWANGAQLFGVLVLGILLSLAMALGSSAAGFAVAGLTAGLVWVGFHWLLQVQGVVLSPLMPLLTLLIVFSGLSTLNFGYAEHKARQRRQALIKAQDTTILRLAALAETRDPETGRHLQRTQGYVRALARELRRHPRYAGMLDATGINLLSKCAPLHDIGKVGIPDHILLKPGRLTPEEFEAMKAHTVIGARVLDATAEDLETQEDDGYLVVARQIALSHHERWDGSGYPHGLKGGDIPLAGRLMALADVYDALTSKRTYKEAFSHEKAKRIIVEEMGKHFDPDLVRAFLTVEENFCKIARRFRE